MLTDIKGFTDKTARQSRAQVMELLKKHKELVLPVVNKFNGSLVKTIGDAFLVTFDSPTDAVLCGVEIQKVLGGHNEGKHHEERIDIRIAINAGEVSISEDEDIFGDAVNITSRIEGMAEAGEVFFTEAVYLAMNKKEVPSSEIGYRQFKGVPEKIKVYKVLRETGTGTDDASGQCPETQDRRKKEDELLLEGLPSGKGLFGFILGIIKAVFSSDAGTKNKARTGSVRINKDGIDINAGKRIRIGKDGVYVKKGSKEITVSTDGRVDIKYDADK